MKYTGMDMESFEEGFREQAERQVKVRLALEAVVKAENIEASAEDIEAEYQKYADMYKIEVEKVKGFIPEADLARDLAVEKALNFLKENAVAKAE